MVRNDLGPDDFADREKQPREHTAHVDPAIRLSKPFEEYDTGLTEEQVFRGRLPLHGVRLRRRVRVQASSLRHRLRGQPGSHSGREHAKGIEEANQYYVRNMDKCILCGQCVRTCDEIAGFHAIDFANRGFAATISPEYFKGIDASD